MTPTRFTADDAQRAFDGWGANCGPGAIAAILGLTLDEVRPHMGDFERKHYTNPTLMWQVLGSLDVDWHRVKVLEQWPYYGLARVQWGGRWTQPGVPPRVAYRYTHWVGAEWSEAKQEFGIFDINCINNGSGWISASDWDAIIVPHLLQEYPGNNGKWHLTHVVEIVPKAHDEQS